MLIFDILILILGWLIAQLAFNGYENHVPVAKRIIKFLIILAILTAIRLQFGRVPFFSILSIMTIGIATLHGYWFHYRNGIHWRTAEPKEKYFQLIGKG